MRAQANRLVLAMPAEDHVRRGWAPFLRLCEEERDLQLPPSILVSSDACPPVALAPSLSPFFASFHSIRPLFECDQKAEKSPSPPTFY